MARHQEDDAPQAVAAPPSPRVSDSVRAAIEGYRLEVAEGIELEAIGLLEELDAIGRRRESGSAAEAALDLRWVSALLGEDPTIHARSSEQSHLVDYVRGWTSRLDLQRSAGAARLIFTLEEPEEADEANETEGRDATQSSHQQAEISDPNSEIADAESSRSGHSPAVADDPWRVTFQLQPLDEDSPAIDARELWAQQPSNLLGRRLAERQTQLLSHLTEAQAAFPPLERALASSAPTDVELTTAEAHQFLRQWGPQLAEQGYGVALPPWASRREVGLHLVVHPHDAAPSQFDSRGASGGEPNSAGSTSFGLDSLLDFDWQIAVGDTRLAPEEFRRIIEQGAPLIRHRGRWIELDLEAARRAMKLIDAKPRGSATLGDAIRIAFFPQDTGLPVLGLRGTGWLEHLLEQTPTAQLQQLKQPEGFIGSLRPYQLRGLDWLSFLSRLGIGGCLADDMGLGKTIQLIALLLHEREPGKDEGGRMKDEEGRGSGSSFILNSSSLPPPGPTLLFAPTSVVSNWNRELQRFAPALRVLVHHGPDRLRSTMFTQAAKEYDIVLTSYALAHRDVEELHGVPWHRIVLDEAQKVKNPNAASTIAIRSIPAPHRVAMTGTPIENHLSELWSIMEILNPGLLGSASEFRERFAVPIEKLHDSDRSAHLRTMIQPFVLRRTKNDPLVAADLPEKLEMKVYCNLTAEQAAWYQRITNDMLGQIDSATGIRRRGLILAALTRLKQVCDHPELVARKFVSDPRTLPVKPQDPDSETLDRRSGKCERLAEMLEEVIDEGDAALVFTQYREMGQLLEPFLARRLGVPVMFLHGGTPIKMRDEMVQRFNSPGSGVRIFLLSLRAGGLGLNLTAANHVFHFDRWWNPAVEAQATDRAHRIGQKRKVQVHKFICVGTMEERIDRMLSEKLALAERIVGSGDEWLTSLSTDQLREALSLSAEAVGEF